MKQVLQLACAQEGEAYLHEAKRSHLSICDWVKQMFSSLQKQEEEAKNLYRLIAPSSFFTDDFLEVKLDFVPKVGHKIRIHGFNGKYLLTRISTQEKEYRHLIKEEGLSETSQIVAYDMLVEKYPYLLDPSNPSFASCRILEAVELL